MYEPVVGIGQNEPLPTRNPALWLTGARALACKNGGPSGKRSCKLPDVERALINPAAVFAEPRAVLGHPSLMKTCKQEILRRWAWDEYLIEVAAGEGMEGDAPSRLAEVKAALLSLGEVWRPKPSAPAAAVPLLQQEEDLLAA